MAYVTQNTSLAMTVVGQIQATRGYFRTVKRSRSGIMSRKQRLLTRMVKPEDQRAPPPPATAVPSAPIESSTLKDSFMYHKVYTAAAPSAGKMEKLQAYKALSATVFEKLIDRANASQKYWIEKDAKVINYISMEYLMGRTLLNAVRNLDLEDDVKAVLEGVGYTLEELADFEGDAALGNGGLGRLAACFLDSMASLDLPSFGYGLRYKYGLFKQLIAEDGTQVEIAEDWLDIGNSWELERKDIAYPVCFYGHVDEEGKYHPGQVIDAVAYDTPVPGFKTENCVTLRLWNATAKSSLFDLASFNAGDHFRAVTEQVEIEKINAVLYPGDDSEEGKVLRLKQQFMLCSATLQDIVNRFKARQSDGTSWKEFGKKFAVQLNDTHPTLAIPEMIRILVDEENVEWEDALKIVNETFAYTNHTVLPEALEKWSYSMMSTLLPRHVQIIEKMDEVFVENITARVVKEGLTDIEKDIDNMRIIEYDIIKQEVPSSNGTNGSSTESEGEAEPEGDDVEEIIVEKNPANIRMANLCVIFSHTINGVAAIHSDIIRQQTFKNFHTLNPEKFQNKTNGVTPRRWLSNCNPGLSKLITETLGSEEWVKEADKLSGLSEFVDDSAFCQKWKEVKYANKLILADYVKRKTSYEINPDFMFDVQIKRIHEYKRQLLNLLGIAYRYKKILEMSPEERADVVPRVCMMGGKAFATYVQAKRIIYLANCIASTINNDPVMKDYMQVVFIPNYNVSSAEVIIPATEISQHISTAGMEASGTSNMKFAMNGSLLIGTLDGANVEIREKGGKDNFFLFGYFEEDIPKLRQEREAGQFVPDPRFTEAVDFIKSGVFGSDFHELLSSLEGNSGFGRGDYFCVGADFPSYIECQLAIEQDTVSEAYKDQGKWNKMSILTCAGSGDFSSDRTIRQYADEIWGVSPLKIES